MRNAQATLAMNQVMAEGKGAARRSKKVSGTFSDEERDAVKDLVQERKIVWGRNRAADEAAVAAKIAKFPEPDRALARRLHSMVKSAAPNLSSRLWYGMPAYVKDGDVVCFFQPAHKFRARYSTFGFTPNAHLDDGEVWATYFSFTNLTDAGTAKLAALVKKSVS